MLVNFSSYAAGGGIAVAARFGILILLVEAWTVRPVLASVLGFVASIFVNYTAISLDVQEWSRPQECHRPLCARDRCHMLGVNTVIFWSCNEPLVVNYILSQVMATGIVVIFNFVINSRYTFVST